MTLNKYLLSFLLSSEILQQINNILDHGIFGVSFYFLFMLLTPKRSKVLQMINYIAFLSLKVRVFYDHPPPPTKMHGLQSTSSGPSGENCTFDANCP